MGVCVCTAHTQGASISAYMCVHVYDKISWASFSQYLLSSFPYLPFSILVSLSECLPFRLWVCLSQSFWVPFSSSHVADSVPLLLLSPPSPNLPGSLFFCISGRSLSVLSQDLSACINFPLCPSLCPSSFCFLNLLTPGSQPTSSSAEVPSPGLLSVPHLGPSQSRSPLIPPFQAKGRESGPD